VDHFPTGVLVYFPSGVPSYGGLFVAEHARLAQFVVYEDPYLIAVALGAPQHRGCPALRILKRPEQRILMPSSDVPILRDQRCRPLELFDEPQEPHSNLPLLVAVRHLADGGGEPDH